jgi:thiamine kinase
VKLFGPVTVPFNIKAVLEQFLAQKLPAAYSAGCLLSPVAGLTGESWKIETPTQSWLARIQSAEKARLGVQRRREKAVLQHLAGLGIAPEITLFSPQWLVVEWLEGNTCDATSATDMVFQLRLSQLLARLHRLAPCGHRLLLRQQLARYWQQIDRRRLTPKWLRLQQHMMRAQMPTPLKLAVLHMDVHPGNLVCDGQTLRLIDWEYAADGDIALELAALFRSNDWTAEQQRSFLSTYAVAGGYRDTARLVRQIRRWTMWVDYLMLMWYEVRWHQTGDNAYSDGAQPLRERLFASGRTGDKTK